MIHGSKRERFISNAAVNQLTLPFELEDSPVIEKAPESQQITYTREKTKRSNHPGRCEFPSHLPVVDVFIEPEESTEGMVCIGEEITSELELDPGRLFVRKIHRKKYALQNAVFFDYQPGRGRAGPAGMLNPFK